MNGKKIQVVLAVLLVVAIAGAAVLGVQVNNKNTEITALQGQITELNAQLEAVNAQLASVEEEIVAANAKLDEYKTYTYNLAIDTFPTNWNPHQYKTATDNDAVMSYVTDGLFSWDYNETQDGYARVPSMTTGDPVDVTAEYVGEEWGIEEGETARAWKYTLRDDLKWENGVSINAQTFVDSVMLQLNPKAQNYRADTLYAGGFVIHNAEAYAKQGTNADTTLGAYIGITGVADMEALLAAHGTEPGYINWSYSFGDTYDFATETWTGAA